MLASLARGINITNWFRFPPSADPARLDAYVSDQAIADLRRAGFTFVRLAVQPALARSPSLPRAVARLRRAGLGVVVALTTQGWVLENSAPDRAALHRIWAGLAPSLRMIDPIHIFPEILNEPVFARDPAGWATLQAALHRTIRASWPEASIILTGANWGGIDGLLALPAPTDGNVIYSIHFYEPAVLTSLAAFEPGLGRAALAALPFPATPGCATPVTDPRTRSVATFYCAQAWNARALEDRIAQAAAWGRRHDAAILIGEFGASVALNAPARLSWLSAARHAFTAHGLGWALWGLEDVMGFNQPRPPPPRLRLDPETLRALALVSPE